MSKKILNWFFESCVFIGFMVILGTAGSDDLGEIDFQTSIILILIGLGITAFGVFGRKLFGEQK